MDNLNTLELLSKNYKQKNYSYCIYILDKEITSILIQKVQKIDKNFSYSTLQNLKESCMKNLDYETKLLVTDFYNLSINKENELIELNKLLDIYNDLKN